MKKKLGVNIDHVATLRQARGGCEPSPLEAAREAQRGGADGITVHLREDRRHIQDADVFQIQKKIKLPLNLEMSIQPEIVKIALKIVPQKVCLVPERRQELTTEGGLDVLTQERAVGKVVSRLKKKKIEVSLFIAPNKNQIQAAARVKADVIEIHTGAYAGARGSAQKQELFKIRKAADLAVSLGLKVNAGHGLNYLNVRDIAKIPVIEELNIGHAIVSRSIRVGLREAVRLMKYEITRG